MCALILANSMLFLSTLSLRRATRRHRGDNGSPIHFYPRSPCGERPRGQSDQQHLPGNFYPRSPCGERLLFYNVYVTKEENFYPRSPCGERQDVKYKPDQTILFLSTLSLRRATSQQPPGATRTTYFYPRSPCGERRTRRHYNRHFFWYFYPRSPCGERQAPNSLAHAPPQISIHALLAESDGSKDEH